MKEPECDLELQEFEKQLQSLVEEFKETGDLSREAICLLAEKVKNLLVTDIK